MSGLRTTPDLVRATLALHAEYGDPLDEMKGDG